jgi:hypothetical protein
MRRGFGGKGTDVSVETTASIFIDGDGDITLECSYLCAQLQAATSQIQCDEKLKMIHKDTLSHITIRWAVNTS